MMIMCYLALISVSSRNHLAKEQRVLCRMIILTVKAVVKVPTKKIQLPVCVELT